MTEPTPRKPPMSIAAAGPAAFAAFAAMMAGSPDAMERRLFKAPELPPGVVPKDARMALDNAPMYGWLNGQPGWCGLGFPGYTYLSELYQRSEYRAPVETIANQMTRQWIKFAGADEAKLKELNEAFEEFRVRENFRAVTMHDGAFGRGQLYVRIKGQESDRGRKLPLNVDDDGAGIGKGQLLGFKPIEPIWTTPYSYNSNDPAADDFYAPSWWYVLGIQTHTSRLLTFISRPVPDILKPSYNFSGMSLSQLTEPYVVRWLKTVDSVNRMISNYSKTGLKTNMQATLEGGGQDELFKRAAMYTNIADNRGLWLADKDSEEFFQLNTPLSELSKLQAQAQEHMAAPTHIPLVILTGISPSGLNASSEGEIKVFYDFIAAEQKNLLDDHLRTVTRIVMLHLWGTVDKDITHEWMPLDSPTDKELSEMRKADGDRDVAYVGGGVVSPDEVRERLRTDPNSGYTHITGDAPDLALEEHELGEEGAEADHARQGEVAEADHKRAGETAEADHKRAKELERIKNQGKNKLAKDEQERDARGRWTHTAEIDVSVAEREDEDAREYTETSKHKSEAAAHAHVAKHTAWLHKSKYSRVTGSRVTPYKKD